MSRYTLLFLIITGGSFQLTAQTTSTFRSDYDLSWIDLSGGAIESLTSNQYVFTGTNLNFLPIYGTVTHVNDTGGVIWSKYYYDGSFGFELSDIKRDDGSNEYYVCGGSSSNAGIFMRLDPSGNVLVSKKFSISQADGAYFKSVQKVSDGGYVLVGYVSGHDPDGGGPEVDFSPLTCTDTDNDSHTEYFGSPLIVKYDNAGNYLWHKVFRYYNNATKAPANRIYNDAELNDVVEVADGYIAVGSYDVTDWNPNPSSDCNDQSPRDAMILKTDFSGNIVYHKQYDTYSTTGTSKYLMAVNKTSTGVPIAVGTCDGGYEWIIKFNGPGGWSPQFSRRFRYSGSFFGTDPAEISEIYEVQGSTDLVTMGMYIKPLSFIFANSIHRVNAVANANIWTKYYTQGFATIIPYGSPTSDGGYIMQSMTFGFNPNNHLIKTDPTGDVDLVDCPPVSITPAASAGPTTVSDPFYNVFTGTVGPQAIAISSGFVSPTVTPLCVLQVVPLPVELTYFRGVNSNGVNRLTWETASEINASHYVLYRSQDGNNWEEIASVQAQGTTQSVSNYYWNDRDFAIGLNYYTLHQYDFNGEVQKYKPIAIENRLEGLKVIRVTDLLGREVDSTYRGAKIFFFADGTKEYRY